MLRKPFLRLGQFEVEDQIDFGKHLIETEPIDPKKVAIWGSVSITVEAV